MTTLLGASILPFRADGLLRSPESSRDMSEGSQSSTSDPHIQVSVLQCPTQKHDLCNPCMIRWMKDSLEQQKDINCVICHQRIHSFMHYRREVLRRERVEAARREEIEIATAEQQLNQMIRGSLERSIAEINQMMGKFLCWAGSGFGLCFIFFICYPGDSTKLVYFMLVYIVLTALIMLGFFLNRLFYISQLNKINRVHPEHTIETLPI